MTKLTRRAFLKLASLCGAAVAGLVELPKTKQVDERLLALAKAAAERQTCTADEAFQRLIDGIKLIQADGQQGKYVIFRNDDGTFLYSNDGGFFFQGPMNFWDMPEDVRKAWWMDRVLNGQCNCELYVVQGCCGKPAW